MKIVILSALGVGGATALGAIVGFLFQKVSHRFSDIVQSFAAGVMLAASIIGLLLPALEVGTVIEAIAGIFAGALCIHMADKWIPHLHRLIGYDNEAHNADRARDRVLLFVLAIAIHNFPEGIAAGVSFGTGSYTDAFLICSGIALQNVPEGMVIIGPMLAAGIPPKKTLLCGIGTGLVEVVGTMAGYFAISAATVVLPFALAFAAGTMLYVISDEMIPETHAHGAQTGATYSLLVGFCLVLVMNAVL